MGLFSKSREEQLFLGFTSKLKSKNIVFDSDMKKLNVYVNLQQFGVASKQLETAISFKHFTRTTLGEEMVIQLFHPFDYNIVGKYIQGTRSNNESPLGKMDAQLRRLGFSMDYYPNGDDPDYYCPNLRVCIPYGFNGGVTADKLQFYIENFADNLEPISGELQRIQSLSKIFMLM